MITIGHTKIVAVRRRDKATGKVVPVYENEQPVTRVEASEVWRVTRSALNGQFGPDRSRKLVVGFISGDLLALRPQGTRQQVNVELKEVYAWVLHRKAMSAHMEKMRERKAAKEAARRERALCRKIRKASA